jgi:hypothetical protein
MHFQIETPFGQSLPTGMKNILGNPSPVADIYICAGVEITGDHEAADGMVEKGGMRSSRTVFRS